MRIFFLMTTLFGALAFSQLSSAQNVICQSESPELQVLLMNPDSLNMTLITQYLTIVDGVAGDRKTTAAIGFGKGKSVQGKQKVSYTYAEIVVQLPDGTTPARYLQYSTGERFLATEEDLMTCSLEI